MGDLRGSLSDEALEGARQVCLVKITKPTHHIQSRNALSQ